MLGREKIQLVFIFVWHGAKFRIIKIIKYSVNPFENVGSEEKIQKSVYANST